MSVKYEKKTNERKKEDKREMVQPNVNLFLEQPLVLCVAQIAYPLHVPPPRHTSPPFDITAERFAVG
jgi:hypothetical protein